MEVDSHPVWSSDREFTDRDLDDSDDESEDTYRPPYETASNAKPCNEAVNGFVQRTKKLSGSSAEGLALNGSINGMDDSSIEGILGKDHDKVRLPKKPKSQNHSVHHELKFCFISG